MFPIPREEGTPFEKKKIDTYRDFRDEEEKSKYIDLLDTEMKEINKMNLSSAAKELYNLKEKFPNSFLAKRCLNYKELEYYAKKWKI